MEDPIRAAYLETVDHLVQAADEIPRKRPSTLKIIIYVVTGPAIFGFQQYLYHETHWIISLLGLSVFYYALIWLVLFSRFHRRSQARKYLARNLRKEPLAVEWKFGEADVIQIGGSESSTRFAWEHFKRAIRKPNGFLLETPNKAFHWIPRTALSSDESFEALARLLKQKIGNYEEIRQL